MQRLIFLIGLLFHGHAGLCQQEALDSLLYQLAKHEIKDTVRLNLLNEIAYAYASVDPEKGLATADSAISLGTKIGDKKKLASAYSNKGVNYWSLGNDSLAAHFYKKALDIHLSNNDAKGIAIAYNNLGLLAFNGADYVKALEYHFKSLQTFQKMKDSSRLPDSYANIGVDYHYLSDYPKALDYYLKGLRIAEIKNNTHARAVLSGNIGLVYKDFSAFQEAQSYQKKALELYKAEGNKQGTASTLGNIGVLYSLTRRHDSALVFFQKALKMNGEIGNSRRIASDLTNLGIVYKDVKNYASAIENLTKAQKIYADLNDRDNTSIVLNQLGSIYALAHPAHLKASGIHPKDRFSTAIDLQEEALQISQEIHAIDRQSEIWKSLSETYEAAGNSEKALFAYKNYSLLHDSVISSEKKQFVMKKAMQFDFEKREDSLEIVHAKQLDLEKLETDRQKMIRSFVLGGAALLFLSAAVVLYLYKRKKDIEQQKKEAIFKAEVSHTEMKALRAQMNPHFIFNSLNSISDYISKNELEKADQYLVKFSKLIRKTLECSEKKLIPMREDLAMLQLYLELESNRMKGKFDFHIHIDEKIDVDNTLIPPLILQPFVENSIWHGISHKTGKGNIEISILRKDGMLHCLIDDDGIGRTAASSIPGKKKGSSMGIKITGARIDLMNQLQNSKGSVEFLDLANGLRAQVSLPLEFNF